MRHRPELASDPHGIGLRSRSSRRHPPRWPQEPLVPRSAARSAATRKTFSANWALPLRRLTRGDLATIASKTDFLGINYYFREIIADDPEGGPMRSRVVETEASDVTGFGWEVYPEGLTELLLRITRDYHPVPIAITENGATYPDEIAADGKIHDEQRTIYIHRHIDALRAAMDGGVRSRRLLRLEPARQLRMGGRLLQTVRPGACRFRDPSADHEKQRPLVCRLPERVTGASETEAISIPRFVPFTTGRAARLEGPKGVSGRDEGGERCLRSLEFWGRPWPSP